MATFYDAQETLLEEVSDRIANLTPDYNSRTPFQRYKDRANDLGSLDKGLIGARQFSISSGRHVGVHGMGYGYSFPLYEYDISIQYPATEIWTRAAHSDALIIRRDLLNYTPSVDGVQARMIKSDATIDAVKDDKNEFQTISLTLVVYYEVTG